MVATTVAASVAGVVFDYARFIVISIITHLTVVADGVDGGSHTCKFDIRHRLHTVADRLCRATYLDSFLQRQVLSADEFLSDASVAVREDDTIANHLVCL